MILYYGTDSYIVSSFTSKELGVQSESDEFEIQLRQVYSHFCFIPVYPKNKFWVLVKNEKFYEVPTSIKNQLMDVKPNKLHVLKAFALPILAMMAILIYNFKLYNENRRFEQLEAEQLKNKGNAIFKDLGKLVPGKSFIFFSKSDRPEWFGEGLNFVILKVEPKRVLLGKIGSIDHPIEMANKNSDSLLGVYGYYSVNKKALLEEFWLDRKILEKAVKRDKFFEGVQIPKLGAEKLHIFDLSILNDSYFVEQTDFEANSEFYKEYVNYGLEVMLDSIVPMVKGDEWKLSKKKNIKFGEKFAIETTSENQAKLYYHLVDHSVSKVIQVKREDLVNNLDL